MHLMLLKKVAKVSILYDSIYHPIRISKSIETESILMTGEWVDGGGGMTANVYRVSFLGDKNILKLCCGDSGTIRIF